MRSAARAVEGARVPSVDCNASAASLQAPQCIFDPGGSAQQARSAVEDFLADVPCARHDFALPAERSAEAPGERAAMVVVPVAPCQPVRALGVGALAARQ